MSEDGEEFMLNVTTAASDNVEAKLRRRLNLKSKYSKAVRFGRDRPDRKAGGRRQQRTPVAKRPHDAALKGYSLGTKGRASDEPDDKQASDTVHGRRQKDGNTVIRTSKRSINRNAGQDFADMTARHVSEDGETAAAELQEALQLAARQERDLAAVVPSDMREPDGNEGDEPLETVSFLDDRIAPGGFRARKRTKVGAEEQPAAKRGKGLGGVVPKKGELVHASAVVPDALRAVVVGSRAAASFNELGIAASLTSHLEASGFKVPTKIQQRCIPVLMAGKDALVEAPTGSGKTLAYLAPIISDLQAEEPRLSRTDGTIAAIIAPTRELCLQITDVLATLLRRYHWLVGGLVTGGENRGKEKSRLRKGVNVLVATPGRLLDHLNSTTAFRAEELRWLVLDEADRLLDLGFEQKIAEVVELLNERAKLLDGRRRQTVLLSATMHSRLQQLAALSLDSPVSIGFRSSAGNPDSEQHETGTGKRHVDDAAERAFAIPKQLKQRFIQVGGKQRLAALAAVLRREVTRKRDAKLVVFMSSCDGVEFHQQLLGDACLHALGEALVDCPIWKLHGNLPQAERVQTFLAFSRCSRGVLICTDVAARGLDFTAVSCIVQYDPPGELTEYIHRVGRTARMGEKGEAVLFLLPGELGYLDLLRKAGVEISELDLDKVFSALPQAPALPAAKAARRPLDEQVDAFAFHSRLAGAVAKDPGLKEASSAAFRSFVRAYATHPASLKAIFHVKRLHLGHVAHSFALREAPSLLGKSASKAAAKKSKMAAKSKHKRGISKSRPPAKPSKKTGTKKTATGKAASKG